MTVSLRCFALAARQWHTRRPYLLHSRYASLWLLHVRVRRTF